MARKIKLSENQLTNIIEKVMREKNITLKEDSEDEETYNYGEDEGADHKEEMDLEHDMDMAPADRIAEIEKHLDALKKDMSFDEDHEEPEVIDVSDVEGIELVTADGEITMESRRKRKFLPEQDDVKGKEEVSKIKGISTSLLHPITQEWMRRPGTKNVFQLIRMMTECHWKGGEVNPDNPEEVVKPMEFDYNSSEVILKEKGQPNGPKFCIKSGAAQVCWNPCKLAPNVSSWGGRSLERKAALSELVPIVKRMLKGSNIFNGYGSADDDATNRKYLKGGNMLGWRADGDSVNTKFTLKRV